MIHHDDIPITERTHAPWAMARLERLRDAQVRRVLLEAVLEGLSETWEMAQAIDPDAARPPLTAALGAMLETMLDLVSAPSGREQVLESLHLLLETLQEIEAEQAPLKD